VNRPRVLLADDHRLVAEGIKSLLTEAFEVVGLVEDGESLVEAARTHRPDLIVADISMPGLNGFEALARIRKENSDARIVVLTMHPELAYVRRALEAGALGYVLKHSAPAELTTAIRAALDGEIYVTPHLAQALDQPVQPGFCAAHNPAESLGLNSSPQLVRWAIKQCLVTI
jgi:DNA-binding NarL/FixJ family response regulator